MMRRPREAFFVDAKDRYERARNHVDAGEMLLSDDDQMITTFGGIGAATDVIELVLLSGQRCHCAARTPAQRPAARLANLLRRLIYHRHRRDTTARRLNSRLPDSHPAEQVLDLSTVS